MTAPTEPTGEPEDVDRAISLPVQSARVSPVLRDAVQVCEREIHRLRSLVGDDEEMVTVYRDDLEQMVNDYRMWLEYVTPDPELHDALIGLEESLGRDAEMSR